MKFKLAYLYFILALGVIVTLFILSGKSNKSNLPGTEIAGEKMPNDDVHNELQNKENPSKSNVNADVYRKMEELKKDADANPGDTSRMKAYADFMTAAH
ncbi:MAG TPA: hypothetical protein VLB50_13380, partial [Ignavibacteriaceae bacterium]|nr:hypothetical protein [Ignavibacteriaceae bacterium]